jgi:hypothetical protein
VLPVMSQAEQLCTLLNIPQFDGGIKWGTAWIPQSIQGVSFKKLPHTTVSALQLSKIISNVENLTLKEHTDGISNHSISHPRTFLLTGN